MEDKIKYAEEHYKKSDIKDIELTKPFNHLGIGTLVNLHDHIE